MKTENRNYQIDHLGNKSYEIEEKELWSDYWDAVINKTT